MDKNVLHVDYTFNEEVLTADFKLNLKTSLDKFSTLKIINDYKLIGENSLTSEEINNIEWCWKDNELLKNVSVVVETREKAFQGKLYKVTITNTLFNTTTILELYYQQVKNKFDWYDTTFQQVFISKQSFTNKEELKEFISKIPYFEKALFFTNHYSNQKLLKEWLEDKQEQYHECSYCGIKAENIDCVIVKNEENCRKKICFKTVTPDNYEFIIK
jgi:hypothetical protein